MSFFIHDDESFATEMKKNKGKWTSCCHMDMGMGQQLGCDNI
jgi:hypothetical protein